MKWKECFDLQPPRYRLDGAGSFGVQSPELVFNALELKTGDCFLDAGCGPGEYALLAATRVGAGGRVIGLDRDARMIEQLQQANKAAGGHNITSLVADLGAPLPLATSSVDAVLISGVLHMPGLDERWGVLFPELYRVLRPDGRLGIIESPKPAAASNLPLHLRLTPATIAEEINPYGFQQSGLTELSSRVLILFVKNCIPGSENSRPENLSP